MGEHDIMLHINSVNMAMLTLTREIVRNGGGADSTIQAEEKPYTRQEVLRRKRDYEIDETDLGLDPGTDHGVPDVPHVRIRK